MPTKSLSLSSTEIGIPSATPLRSPLSPLSLSQPCSPLSRRRPRSILKRPPPPPLKLSRTLNPFIPTNVILVVSPSLQTSARTGRKESGRRTARTTGYLTPASPHVHFSPSARLTGLIISSSHLSPSSEDSRYSDELENEYDRGGLIIVSPNPPLTSLVGIDERGDEENENEYDDSTFTMDDERKYSAVGRLPSPYPLGLRHSETPSFYRYPASSLSSSSPSSLISVFTSSAPRIESPPCALSLTSHSNHLSPRTTNQNPSSSEHIPFSQISNPENGGNHNKKSTLAVKMQSIESTLTKIRNLSFNQSVYSYRQPVELKTALKTYPRFPYPTAVTNTFSLKQGLIGMDEDEDEVSSDQAINGSVSRPVRAKTISNIPQSRPRSSGRIELRSVDQDHEPMRERVESDIEGDIGRDGGTNTLGIETVGTHSNCNLTPTLPSTPGIPIPIPITMYASETDTFTRPPCALPSSSASFPFPISVSPESVYSNTPNAFVAPEVVSASSLVSAISGTSSLRNAFWQSLSFDALDEDIDQDTSNIATEARAASLPLPIDSKSKPGRREAAEVPDNSIADS